MIKIAKEQMTKKSNQKKLLIKNSAALYMRMMLTIVIGLYTSRVVLEALGVDDYGIYNIVGGVVGLTSFLNASMSSASSRFITYELGKGDFSNLLKTFETSITIHLGIAVLVFIICETIGIWFINYKLVLPPGSLSAANLVFQMSILSTCVSIIQVPYSASIMAHEKMNVYAYIEILNSILKLGIALILLNSADNKLELYSLLLAISSIVIFLIYYMYGRIHFRECRFKPIIERTFLKPMLSYSGWDMLGNLSVTAKQQGGAIVLNLFYGVIANAASGIANVVNGTILGLSQIVMTAFRPQIIKNYSMGEIDEFLKLTHLSFKIALIFYACVSIPVFICMDNLLFIWLGNPPEYSNQFCRILLISGFFNIVSVVFITGIHATGKIKIMNIIGLACNFLTIIGGYIGYILGARIYWLYICFCIFNSIISLGCMIILKSQVKALSMSRIIADILKVLICYSIIYLGSYMGHILVKGPYPELITVCCISTLLTIFCLFFLLLNHEQRKRVSEIIKSKFQLRQGNG